MTTGDGLTIGIDVGGTKIAAGLVTADGELRAHARHESPAADATAIVGAIGDLVEKLIGSAEGQGEKVVGAGVAAAGFIDKERSNVIFAPNLAWRDEPLRAHLEQRVGLPVVVENDANAAAWGEFRFGAAADVDDLLLVTVGTGIGGGIVIDGNVLRGGFGFGAEVGHMCVVPEGRPCGCGNRGCWEQYCSGNALVRDTREAVTDPAAQALLERAGGDPERIDGPMITALAAEGDPFCVARFADLGTWLGAGIASLGAVLDPTVIVVGGGVSDAGDLLLEPVRSSYARLLTARAYRPIAQIRQASLGNRAGLLGAADLARTPVSG
ncbi:MAG TPA: ROK family glucokinase [Marmoricola sp.]